MNIYPFIEAEERGRRNVTRACALLKVPRAAGLAGDYQVVLSLGRTGQCWDNALAESFFASLKGELIDLQAWPARPAPGGRLSNTSAGTTAPGCTAPSATEAPPDTKPPPERDLGQVA